MSVHLISEDILRKTTCQRIWLDELSLNWHTT